MPSTKPNVIYYYKRARHVERVGDTHDVMVYAESATGKVMMNLEKYQFKTRTEAADFVHRFNARYSGPPQVMRIDPTALMEDFTRFRESVKQHIESHTMLAKRFATNEGSCEMGEQKKKVVDVALVKLNTSSPEEDTSTLVPGKDLLQTRYYMVGENADVDRQVRHDNHELIEKLGGPQAVEVLVSRPFA
jgi:hypothetical protein